LISDLAKVSVVTEKVRPFCWSCVEQRSTGDTSIVCCSEAKCDEIENRNSNSCYECDTDRTYAIVLVQPAHQSFELPTPTHSQVIA
jgi:hypothetical protein